MSKVKTVIAALMLFPATAFAGGLLTNTNQNVSFLRQMCQDGIIDITGLYANPAGTAFLSKGWHLSLNIQSAKQSRDITTDFMPFALNTKALGQTTHMYHGNAVAPVIPSFQLSWNHDKWSVNANFAIGGGGGKCEFANGLGSFEALTYQSIMKGIATEAATAYAAVAMPGLLASGMTPDQAKETVAKYGATYAQTNLKGYSLKSSMKGRNYVFGLTLGGTYKFRDNLAGFVGLRLQYANNSYSGGISGITMNMPNPATGEIVAIPATYTNAAGKENKAEVEMDCKQSGFSAAPIIGIDWKINDQWNVAAKYEAPTKMVLKNKTTMNEYTQAMAAEDGSALAAYADGAEVREDIPGILTLGVQYSPIKTLRLNAGFHEYFDKSATRGDGSWNKDLTGNTWELLAGAEYDVCKWLTVSASWQKTNYGLADANMNDMSFNVDGNSLGVGCRIKASSRCNIDLGYMHTFYKDRTVVTPTGTLAGDMTNFYQRKNRVLGIGVNLNF